MAAELFYTPTEPPATPFAVGDKVNVFDRRGAILSQQTVTKASPRRVTTSCGRRWTQQGEWFDGERSWPFPSIGKADAAGVPGRAYPECEWCTLCGKRDHVEARCPTVTDGVRPVEGMSHTFVDDAHRAAWCRDILDGLLETSAELHALCIEAGMDGQKIAGHFAHIEKPARALYAVAAGVGVMDGHTNARHTPIKGSTGDE